jgi:hypothetical protein
MPNGCASLTIVNSGGLALLILLTTIAHLLSGRHGRACRGHPRLAVRTVVKTWMRGMNPRMTSLTGQPCNKCGHETLFCCSPRFLFHAHAEAIAIGEFDTGFFRHTPMFGSSWRESVTKIKRRFVS